MAESLGEALALMLPPGLLFDSPAIYAEVAKLPIVPLEDVRRHWHTYTSMSKKSCDPTAYRLENFWWHVWGSDRRHLSGKTLARLWQDIASGPTAVPLRTPQWPFDLVAIAHTQSLYESDRPKLPSTDHSGNQDDVDASSSKQPSSQNLTPSSSRPAPAHPILKKPRGPSTSGPRPTARFADVPDSEDEANQQSSGSQQSISEVSQQSEPTIKKKPVTARLPPRTSSPSKMDRKSSTGKKFVASSTALKRRPVLPRRESSQSSTGSAVSDTTSRDGSATRQSALQSPLVASPQEETPVRRQAASGSSAHLEVPPASAKKLGKRVANSPNLMKQSTTKGSQQQRSRIATNAARNTSSPLARGENTHRHSSTVQQESKETLEEDDNLLSDEPPPSTSIKTTSKRMTATPNNPPGIYDGAASREASCSITATENADEKQEKAKHVSSKPPTGNGKQRSSSIQSTTAPAMARSKSHEAKRMSTGGPVSSATMFKSPSVVGMSKFAVTGGFDFETPKARIADNHLPPLGADEPDIQKTSVLDSRFAPTQPSSSPAPILGRSKSQLTLLLERDKARVGGDKHKFGSSSSSNNNHHHNDGKKR